MTRLAMISGPRNVSTALMRSFEARPDTEVVDEPLYAAYLARTGLRHPGLEDILASQPNGYREALDALRGEVRGLQYEKHMAHHLLDTDDLRWLEHCRVGLLLRHPRAVVASYARVREDPVPEDLGFLQQLRVLEALRALGRAPVVVHSERLLQDPPKILRRLCEAWDIPWTEAMLGWSAGPRESDGVWAPHWYASVEASTGFGPPSRTKPEVPRHLEPVVDALMPVYEAMLPLAL